MATVLKVVVAAVVALALYLVAWPVDLEPVAWQPPADSSVVPTAQMGSVKRLPVGSSHGPEGTAWGPDGWLYTGLVDGRIIRMDVATGKVEDVANTGGRVLGLQFDAQGNLLACDGVKGLLLVSANGTVQVLVDTEGGKPFRFTDDLDIGADGTVYFTDASARRGVHEYRMDVLEHGQSGRLLSYSPATGEVKRLADGLSFANGVALSGDGSFVAINETWNYRVLRYWLTGPKAGTLDTLVDNLPGFPDNITYAPQRGIFWVALFAPRNAALDALAPYPFLRRLLWRLPQTLQPQAAPVARLVGVTPDGTVTHYLERHGPEAYAPITSVLEHQGSLYLGSLMADAVGVMEAPGL